MSTAARDPALRLASLDWRGVESQRAELVAAIERVLANEAAERVLDRYLRNHRQFDSRERAQAAEAIFGVALWRRRLAQSAAPAGGLRWSDETHPSDLPAHAAALFDALLDLSRELARDPQAHAALAPPVLCSLPDWLWEHLREQLGDAAAREFAQAICRPGPVFLRANRLRADRARLAGSLRAEGIGTAPCDFAPDGLRVLTARPNLLGSQAFRRGEFEAQDEGSQLLGELLEAEPGETLLDLCAGAGGKSLQLAAQVGAAGRVLCFDVDRGKLARLRTRAARAGASSIELLDELPPQLRVDRALVDAPCSELGTLRRGPDARFRIDRAAMRELPTLQPRLLAQAAARLRPGGRLVYATCTLSRAEDESVALAFEQAHPGFVRVRPARVAARFFTEEKLFRALPHRDGTDAFFAAAWDRE